MKKQLTKLEIRQAARINEMEQKNESLKQLISKMHEIAEEAILYGTQKEISFGYGMKFILNKIK